MREVSVLVTGAAGQLGREIQALAPLFPSLRFVFTDSAELDLGNASAVARYLDGCLFHWCINCAAYTAVDKAENDATDAYRVNADGAGYLAKSCASNGVHMIHLSTDYVFHTSQNRPFREDDPTHPQGVYAKSKLAGEDAVLAEHPLGGMILRTSWVYSSHGHNFVKTMLKLGSERQELRVVCDQIGSPTYARDLALAILQAVQDAENGIVPVQAMKGIFHFSNEGVASWYDFAVAIFEIAGMKCRVLPVLTAAYPTPAKRPPFSVLDKSKWKQTFGRDIPHWRKSLQSCLSLLLEAPLVAPHKSI